MCSCLWDGSVVSVAVLMIHGVMEERVAAARCAQRHAEQAVLYNLEYLYLV